MIKRGEGMSATFEPDSGSESDIETTGPPRDPLPGIPDVGDGDDGGPAPEDIDERLHRICGEAFTSREDLEGEYAEKLVELQRTPYHSYEFGDSPWSPDFTTHVTVGPDMGPGDIAEAVVRGSRDHLQGDPVDTVRTVYDEAKAEAGLIAAGGAAIGYGLTNPGDAAVMGAQIPTDFLFEIGFGLGGAGATGMHNKLGPKSILGGVKDALSGERPLREEHQELLDTITDDLYIVDTQQRDRDLGELDDIANHRGYDGLEEDGIMAGAGYEAMKKKDEAEVGPCSFYAMVLDGTADKFRLRHVVEEYTEVGTPMTAHEAVTAEPVYAVSELVA